MADLGDIQIVEAPRLSKLEQFDARFLNVDRRSPLAQALNAKMNADPFLRDFGSDTINQRDYST